MTTVSALFRALLYRGAMHVPRTPREIATEDQQVGPRGPPFPWGTGGTAEALPSQAKRARLARIGESSNDRSCPAAWRFREYGYMPPCRGGACARGDDGGHDGRRRDEGIGPESTAHATPCDGTSSPARVTRETSSCTSPWRPTARGDMSRVRSRSASMAGAPPLRDPPAAPPACGEDAFESPMIRSSGLPSRPAPCQ
jgi:hypothetical protein